MNAITNHLFRLSLHYGRANRKFVSSICNLAEILQQQRQIENEAPR
jgi:hypothetical protein